MAAINQFISKIKYNSSPIKIHQSVLFVDSNPYSAKMMGRLIQELNHTDLGYVSTLKDLNRSIDIHGPDMIIINIATKGELDGYELAKYIKTEYEIPFCILCNEKNIDERKWADELNPDGFITYTPNENMLRSQLRILLD